MIYTYEGPNIDDVEILDHLPSTIARSLKLRNGFITAHGGFHMRGACKEPSWHSLRKSWEGESALHILFPAVKPDYIPLAEDCFGDQYLLRNSAVIRLSGETGDLEELNLNWFSFLEAVENNPVEFLSLQGFERWRQQGNELSPGQLLSVYPPFISTEGSVSLRPVPALDRIGFLADFAKQIFGVPDGSSIKIKVV